MEPSLKTAETAGTIFGFRTFWLVLLGFCMMRFEVVEPVQSLNEAQMLHFPNEGDDIAMLEAAEAVECCLCRIHGLWSAWNGQLHMR
jgi:hypothetical protein